MLGKNCLRTAAPRGFHGAEKLGPADPAVQTDLAALAPCSVPEATPTRSPIPSANPPETAALSHSIGADRRYIPVVIHSRIRCRSSRLAGVTGVQPRRVAAGNLRRCPPPWVQTTTSLFAEGSGEPDREMVRTACGFPAGRSVVGPRAGRRPAMMQPLPTRASAFLGALGPKGYRGARYLTSFSRERCSMHPPVTIGTAGDLLHSRADASHGPCDATSSAGPGASQPQHRHSKSEGRGVLGPALPKAADALGLKRGAPLDVRL